MIKFNEITWYSKLSAIVFFIGIFPALVFYIGAKYQEVKTMEELNIVEISNTHIINKSPSLSEQTSGSSIYNDITSYEWVWKETHHGTGPQSLLGGKTVPNKPGVFKLVFGDNGKISGTTDCNSFSGTYSLQGGTIDFGPFMSTKMFCEKSQEEEFLLLIRKGDLGINQDNLYLEHDQTLIFGRGIKIK